MSKKMATEHYLCGLKRILMCDYGYAVMDFERASREWPDNPYFYYARAVAHSKRKPIGDEDTLAKALADLTTAIKIKPDFVEAFYLMGRIFFIRKEYKKAKQAFRNVIKHKYQHTEAHFNLAQTCWKLYISTTQADRHLRIAQTFKSDFGLVLPCP